MKTCNVYLFLTYLIATSGISSATDPESTTDVPVRQIHSHNDYLRKHPFYDAVERGFQSIEVDVWILDNNDPTIYVGHNTHSLNKKRTFDSLYIQPILETLNKSHDPIYHSAEANHSPEFNQYVDGIFQSNASAILYLFVDVKSNGATTWPKVIEALQPLREKGYLTDFNGTDITYRQVTVIGTGNTPLESLLQKKNRDYFFDAPLNSLNSTFPVTLSPIASADQISKPMLEGLA